MSLAPETFQCHSPVSLEVFSILHVPVGKSLSAAYPSGSYPAAYQVGLPKPTGLFVQNLPSKPSSSQKPFSMASNHRAIGTSRSKRSFESSPSIPIPASTVPLMVTPPLNQPSSFSELWAADGFQMKISLTDWPAERVMLKFHSLITMPMGCQISRVASAVIGEGSTPP